MHQSLAITSTEDIVRRIRGEFLEMPGLCLTPAQAQRLWGLDAQTCDRMLASLTEEHFLCLRSDGSYGRLSDSAAAFPQVWNSSRGAAKKSA